MERVMIGQVLRKNVVDDDVDLIFLKMSDGCRFGDFGGWTEKMKNPYTYLRRKIQRQVMGSEGEIQQSARRDRTHNNHEHNSKLS
jgi:hypothetical protein